MTASVLRLPANGLLSKWGFNDGDSPDEYLDWCDEHCKPYGGDWDDVLPVLVETHLLPELRKHHAVEVRNISTAHNPIRASIIDGQDVTDVWHLARFEMTLTPEFVEVPMDVVWKTANGA